MNDDSAAASAAARQSAASRRGAILVATNGSPRCCDAVEWAAAEADARGTWLRVVHAVNWPPVTVDRFTGLPVDRLGAITAAGEAILDEATSRAHAIAPGIEVVRQLEFDRVAATAIVRAATSDALIVLGRRREGRRPARRFKRSTAVRVARGSACPVAVIGLLDEAERPTAGPVIAIGAAERRGVDVVALRVGEPGTREFETALDERTRPGLRPSSPRVSFHQRWLASPTALVAESAGAALVVLSEEAPRCVRRALFGRLNRWTRRPGLGPVVLVRTEQ
jgi:nucleotide-binding universal stress UspA family protein